MDRTGFFIFSACLFLLLSSVWSAVLHHPDTRKQAHTYIHIRPTARLYAGAASSERLGHAQLLEHAIACYCAGEGVDMQVRMSSHRVLCMLRLRGGATRGGGLHGMQGSGPMAVDSGRDVGSLVAEGSKEKRVFVMGGFVIGYGHSMLTDVVESYSPDTGGWRKEPSLPADVSGSRAETVGGCIYVMGGQDNRFLGPARANLSGCLLLQTYLLTSTTVQTLTVAASVPLYSQRL